MSPRDVLLTLFVVACWGVGFALAKPAVDQFPAVFLMTVCFALTGGLLLFAVRAPAATSHARAALIALFAVTLQAALIFKGLEGLPASTAVLVAQTQVPIAVLWVWALRTEAFDPAKLGALALALLGAFVIAGLPAEPPPILPLVTLLAGNAAWGLGQVLLRRVALHGAAQLAVASLLLERGQWASVRTATGLEWGALAFVAVFGFAIAYVVWFGLLRRNPVSAVTPFVMLMPVISVLTAMILLGESPSRTVLAGGALIIGGVVLASGVWTRLMPRRALSETRRP